MPVDPSPYVLEVEPLYLGADVKAVGLELIDSASREPARGAHAACIWAAALPVLAAAEPWALDFFSHLERVREFCRRHEIAFRAAADRGVVIPPPRAQPLA